VAARCPHQLFEAPQHGEATLIGHAEPRGDQLELTEPVPDQLGHDRDQIATGALGERPSQTDDRRLTPDVDRQLEPDVTRARLVGLALLAAEVETVDAPRLTHRAPPGRRPTTIDPSPHPTTSDG
jgi:hypothetical protein